MSTDVVGKRVALALLIAAHVAAPLAAFGFSMARPDDWAARNVFRVVTFSEAGMLAVWAALSGAAWPRRAAVAVLGGLLSWILLAVRHPKYSTYWLAVYVLVACGATLLLTMAVEASQRRRAEQQATAGRWQFTTRDLLLFTTAIGVSIVCIQWFLASRTSTDALFLLAEGSQLSLLVALGMLAGPDHRPRRQPAREAARYVVTLAVVCGLGFVMQSYLSASWFWDALRALRQTPIGVLWEDLFSIPTTVLIESLFAVATVRFWRGKKSHEG
ncbi:MAG TPA: hypothetical protein VJ783_25660 [Pirellulales bacterium]|nr:hypothetical protein [Pirellulales bacterium]